MFGGMRRLFRKVGTTALVLGLFVGVGIAVQALSPEVAYAYTSPEEATWANSLVMWIGNVLAQIINFIGDAIGSLTLVIIEVIVVNVLSYNNFSSSSIVTLGWTLTRDMVNMFAVIVLLILAVKTMVGQGSSAWQQHLPRFFLGIVFANFSRTICGLAVDASQIVMMTFVNALMSIAAGNFAQLMVMPQATTYSSATFEGASEAGITLVTLASNIANAYVKLMVQVAVMIVILLLAVAFIWRIIMLWIAFIMAPFAGFSWGSMDIIKWLGRVWNEWVQGFVPPLILGPMLAFFLYLALAASSNGHLAKAEAFPEPEKRTTYGQITLEIFESTNFTGLLIAIVFLLMGTRESAKIASKMGGLAAMALNEKTGRRALSLGARVSGATVGNVAKLGTRGALRAAGLAGSGIQLVGNKVGDRYGNSLLGKSARGVGVLGGLAEGAANAIDRQVRLIPTDATKMPGYAKNRGAAMAKGASDTLSKVGANMTKGIANNEYLKKVPGLASALNVVPNSILSAGSALHVQEHHISEEEKKKAKERVSHMTDKEKAARLQQFLADTGEKSVEAFADAKHLQGLMFSDKNLEKTFRENMGDAKYEEEVTKILSTLQHEDEAGHLSVDKETWNKARSKYTDLYLKAAGKDNAKKFIESDDFNVKAVRKEAVAKPEVVMALASAMTGDKKDGKFQTRFDQLSDRQKSQVQGQSEEIFKKFSSTMFTQDSSPGARSGASAAGGSIDDHLRAFSRLEGNAAKLNRGTADEIAKQLQAIESDPTGRGKNFQAEELAAVRKNLMAAGLKLNEVFNGAPPYDPASYDIADSGKRKAFKSLIAEDATILREVDDAALAGDTVAAKAAFDGLSKDSIEKMKELVESGARDKRQTEDALKKIETLLNNMENKARNGVSKADLDALSQQIKDTAEKVHTSRGKNEREKHQADLEAYKAKREAMVNQMDNDALAKVKTLRASQEATKRYL